MACCMELEEGGGRRKEGGGRAPGHRFSATGCLRLLAEFMSAL